MVNMHIQSFFLDVAKTPWVEENRSSILFFSAIALVAIGILVGIFIYRRKKKNRK